MNGAVTHCVRAETPERLLQLRQQQFNAAMDAYEKKKTYVRTGLAVSVINVSLQAGLLVVALQPSIGVRGQIIALAAAFVLADFLNGFVHLLLDNSDHYTSFWGPFIAAFHLHHRTPLYKRRNILLVYFQEAGSKIWLSFYFAGVAVAAGMLNINPVVLHALVYFGIFSCLAEVSHYCCHVSSSPVPKLLARLGIFMTKRHHGRHHLEDNNRYAFLNGMSDPLLNWIAIRFFKGYKTTTDLHYANYSGAGTSNRE